MDRTPPTTKLDSDHRDPGDPSPSAVGRGKPPQQLSASLRERLKRTRRSFASPVSIAKRLCVDAEDDGGRPVPTDPQEVVNNPLRSRHAVDVNKNEVTPETEGAPGDWARQREHLRRQITEKAETLRRLKMVKMYRSKNDLERLHRLVDKWRSSAQAALCELRAELPADGPKASLSQLIDLFGLDDKILHFNRSEDDFTT